MKAIITANPLLSTVLNVWTQAQQPMYKVKRWGKHHRKYARLRRQSTLEHTYSICILVDIVTSILSRRRNIDHNLLRRAFLYHDFSEGILGRDVTLRNKTDRKDLAEYLAIKAVLEQIDKDFWREVERDYLLQFARKNPRCFPLHAREVMSELWNRNRIECLLFYGIETLDYILYPLSHKKKAIAPDLFFDVIVGNASKLDRLSKELPEFGELIWTPDVSDAVKEFAREHYASNPVRRNGKAHPAQK